MQLIVLAPAKRSIPVKESLCSTVLHIFLLDSVILREANH
jgi:hypothetical protein